MDIGEAVSVAMESSGKCPMQHEEPAKITSQPAKSVKSVETLKSNMASGKSTILFDVDGSGKLADKGLQVRCSEDPSPKDDIVAKHGASPIKLDGRDYPLSVAAHHLIPGEDSLPKSPLAKFVWKSEGTIAGDIGYHIDGAENGLWLPTHQSMSAAMGEGKVRVTSESDPSKTERARYGEMSKLDDGSTHTSFIYGYTQIAMQLVGGQFHDSHKEYSQKVVDMLGAVALWVHQASSSCQKCADAIKQDGKVPPPHFVAFRLNALAGHLRSLLIGSPLGWKEPFFTSGYARKYKESEVQYMKHLQQRERGTS